MADSIHWFDTIDSTNTRLLADKEALPDRSVYAALFQTAGRGQKGNRWESRPGENLTFSILFKPEGIPAREQFILSQVVALGLLDFLRTEQVEATIKWPNDIYIGDRKVCGTLIEPTLSGGLLRSAVAGIGLNLNQSAFDPSLPNPTSLGLVTGQSYDLKATLTRVLAPIFSRCDKLYSAYARNGYDAEYMEHLYRRGEWHSFEVMPATEVPTEHRSGERLTARILGIDNAARLLLEHADGTLHPYSFKEIKYII